MKCDSSGSCGGTCAIGMFPGHSPCGSSAMWSMRTSSRSNASRRKMLSCLRCSPFHSTTNSERRHSPRRSSHTPSSAMLPSPCTSSAGRFLRRILAETTAPSTAVSVRAPCSSSAMASSTTSWASSRRRRIAAVQLSTLSKRADGLLSPCCGPGGCIWATCGLQQRGRSSSSTLRVSARPCRCTGPLGLISGPTRHDLSRK
mmetsp:Transcript_25873/g.60271  ORF Transcript_25873/g.60271 Transcript_25873/m.60271 type:complete len:201 (+) Transcript_25873:1263-1865(+)